MNNKKVMIFSAPSGAGKSTIVAHLMKRFSFLGFSVSATSRAPREKRGNGKSTTSQHPKNSKKDCQ